MGFQQVLLQSLMLFTIYLGTAQSGAIPDGVDCISYEQKCLEISSTALTWFQAQNYCLRRGGHVVNIQNSEEMDFIAAELISRGHKHDNFWIDGNDLATEGEFCSMKDGLAMPYTKWKTGEPNNAYGGESCVEIVYVSHSFQMNDKKCEREIGVICEFDVAIINKMDFLSRFFETLGKNYSLINSL